MCDIGHLYKELPHCYSYYDDDDDNDDDDEDDDYNHNYNKILKSDWLSTVLISAFILLHEKLLRFDWLRAAVFQLNLKYLHVKITNLLRVVV